MLTNQTPRQHNEYRSVKSWPSMTFVSAWLVALTVVCWPNNTAAEGTAKGAAETSGTKASPAPSVIRGTENTTPGASKIEIKGAFGVELGKVFGRSELDEDPFGQLFVDKDMALRIWRAIEIADKESNGVLWQSQWLNYQIFQPKNPSPFFDNYVAFITPKSKRIYCIVGLAAEGLSASSEDKLLSIIKKKYGRVKSENESLKPPPSSAPFFGQLFVSFCDDEKLRWVHFGKVTHLKSIFGDSSIVTENYIAYLDRRVVNMALAEYEELQNDL